MSSSGPSRTPPGSIPTLTEVVPWPGSPTTQPPAPTPSAPAPGSAPAVGTGSAEQATPAAGPDSPDAIIVTVHAAPQYSRELWGVPENVALETLEAGLHPFLASGASIIEAQLKRWRYALPTVLHPERFLIATGLAPLAFAGDAFGEARVEGATLSGLAAGAALAARLV